MKNKIPAITLHAKRDFNLSIECNSKRQVKLDDNIFIEHHDQLIEVMADCAIAAEQIALTVGESQLLIDEEGVSMFTPELRFQTGADNKGHATKVGDQYHDKTVTSGADSVFWDDQPVARKGDGLRSETQLWIGQGAPSVLVEERPLAIQPQENALSHAQHLSLVKDPSEELPHSLMIKVSMMDMPEAEHNWQGGGDVLLANTYQYTAPFRHQYAQISPVTAAELQQLSAVQLFGGYHV